MTLPADLITLLRQFNRKERFYVVGTALGNRDFRLSADFRARLDEVFGVGVPATAFAAMDYHLDWLFAAVKLATNGETEGVWRTTPQIKSTQEDIDLLVVYRDSGVHHVIMIEAKGVGGFTNKQMESKRRRLQSIFGGSGAKHERIRPHFGVMSPRKPSRNVSLHGWPAWMRPNGELPWIEMRLPRGLKAVMRCDRHGVSRSGGGYWTVVDRRQTRE